MNWISKINSVVLIFFCLMAVASALTIGGIITQQQLNTINIQTTDLEPEIESKEKAITEIRVWFSYFTLEELEDGTYEVQRQTDVAVYSLKNYNSCRENGNSKEDCIALGRASMISQAKSIIRGEKSHLEGMQGQDYTNEITAEDFDISDNDLG